MKRQNGLKTAKCAAGEAPAAEKGHKMRLEQLTIVNIHTSNSRN